MGKHRVKRVGKPQSAETKAKRVAAWKRTFEANNTRQKMSDSHKGKVFTEAHREALRQRAVKAWQDPEMRHKMTVAITAVVQGRVKSKGTVRKKRLTVRERAIESAKRLLEKAKELTQGKR